MFSLEMTMKRYRSYLCGLVFAMLFASPMMLMAQGYFGSRDRRGCGWDRSSRSGREAYPGRPEEGLHLQCHVR